MSKAWRDDDDFTVEPMAPPRTYHARKRQTERGISDKELRRMVDAGTLPITATGVVITAYRPLNLPARGVITGYRPSNLTAPGVVLAKRVIAADLIGHFVGKGGATIKRNFPDFKVRVANNLVVV